VQRQQQSAFDTGARGDGGRIAGGDSTAVAADASAEQWKNNFIRAPYLRDALVRKGFVCETFETATTWEQFWTLHTALNLAVRSAAERVGIDARRVFMTCRFTHAYIDGPAPYYTIVVLGDAQLRARLRQWDAMKQGICETLLKFGATATHHHAVGKDHRAMYNNEVGALFLDGLAAVKRRWDPRWVLNPGVLLPLGLYNAATEAAAASSSWPSSSASSSAQKCASSATLPMTRLPKPSSSAVPSAAVAIAVALTPSIRAKL
jgi:FAD/FMN-containing dehydrogenase